MTKTSNTYQYDLFISYSHHDKEWVHDWLLPRLEASGLRVCIDHRDFEPGVASLVNMENAVERSRKTLIVLTPAWVDSEWTTFEGLLIQTDDPAGRQGRMIPLRLKPCELPKRIAMLTYLDFTQETEVESQLQRLVETIRPKPISQPETFRVREAWVVWSFPFFLPDFSQQTLHDPFCALALPFAELSLAQKLALRPRREKNVPQVRVPDFGRLVLDTEGLYHRWLPPKTLQGARSGLAFVPFLLDIPWRPHWSGPADFADRFRVTARLRFHLFPAGVCMASLVTGVRGLGKDGVVVDDWIHLLKHLSPGDATKRSTFDVPGPLRRASVPSDELLGWLVGKLAARLYRTDPPMISPSTARNRHGRIIYLYDTDRRLSPEHHSRPMFGLLNLHSTWSRLDKERILPQLESNLGHELGDWIRLEGTRALLYTPLLAERRAEDGERKSSHRRSRRLFLWRIVAGIETALTVDLLLRELPRALDTCSDVGQQERLESLADDLTTFPVRLPTYQRKVYALTAEALHIEQSQAALRDILERRQREGMIQGMAGLAQDHALLASNQARLESRIDRLTDELLQQVKGEYRPLTETLVSASGRGLLQEQEAQATLTTIAQALEEIKQRSAEMPASLVRQAEQVAEAIEEPGLTVAHKLKVSLPIIPTVLSYEGEVSLGQRMNLEATWQRLTQWVRTRIGEQ